MDILWHPINISHCGECQTPGWLIVVLLCTPLLRAQPRNDRKDTQMNNACLYQPILQAQCSERERDEEIERERDRWKGKVREIFQSWSRRALYVKLESHNDTIAHKVSNITSAIRLQHSITFIKLAAIKRDDCSSLKMSLWDFEIKKAFRRWRTHTSWSD